MRAGASSVQQMFTLESALVLKNAVAEACRRGHTHVTPLHVVATLLSTHGSLLREACLRTHQSHSSSLPECRALELCFNIAVERLQSSQCLLPDGQPSYNNALVTALRRAQAHQRRGCPEQQQQPLLAVKVGLEQLVLSILDDPSVSKVMQEAGFSSTDVKNHLEAVVKSTTPQSTPSTISAAGQQSQMSVFDQMSFRLGGGPIPAINRPFLHTRPTFNRLPCNRNDTVLPLQPQPSLVEWPAVHAVSPLSKSVGFGGRAGGEAAATTAAIHAVTGESRRVLDVFLQRKKRNPLLVGETSANVDAVMRHVICRVERGDLPDQLKGVKVLSLKLSPLSVLSATREELKLKFIELNESVLELKKGGVIIHLGDLQWLMQLRRSYVISAPSSIEFCAVTYAVQEISDLLARHHRTGNGRLWLMGSATNHTFSSFQSQHSCLENEWELQLVPITPSSRLNISKNKICESGGKIVDPSLTLSLRPSSAIPAKGILPDEEDISEVKDPRCSSDCMVNSEKEGLSVRGQERDVAGSPPCSSSVETPNTDTAETSSFHSALPAWLRNAVQSRTTNTPECKIVQDHHISSHVDYRIQLMQSRQMAPVIPPASVDNSFLRRIDTSMASALQKDASEHELLSAFRERIDDLTGCSHAKIHQGHELEWVEAGRTPHTQRNTDPYVTGKALDVDALARLCKGLVERVGWQKSVISVVANTIMQCRSGRTKRQWAGLKSDAWLLLLGPDRDGKQKMAEALAELMFGCEKNPVCLQLGQSSRSLGPVPSRGKMPLDRVADAVRQNPSSLVLMLEDVEQLDVVCRLGLVKAMEKGRLQDSSGREVSLSSAIVLLTTSIGGEQSPVSKPSVNNGDPKDLHLIDGEALVSLSKRKGKFACCSHKKIRLMGRALSLDLNLSSEENEEDRNTTQCTPMEERSTEDPTNEEQVLLAARMHLKEFYDLVDATVVFSCAPVSMAMGDSL